MKENSESREKKKGTDATKASEVKYCKTRKTKAPFSIPLRGYERELGKDSHWENYLRGPSKRARYGS